MGQRYQRGRIWWIKYYVNGRPVRESTGTDKEQEARRLLKTREGHAAAGMPMLPRADRIRYEEIATDQVSVNVLRSGPCSRAKPRLVRPDGEYGRRSA